MHLPDACTWHVVTGLTPYDMDVGVSMMKWSFAKPFLVDERCVLLYLCSSCNFEV